MINSTSASNAALPDAIRSRADNETDDDLFTNELKKRLQTPTTRNDKIQASLDTLKSMFPSGNFSVDDKTNRTGNDLVTLTADKQITLNSSVLERMADDASLARQIQQASNDFLSAIGTENLLDEDALDSAVMKSIDIQTEYVGYYETYVGNDNGKTEAATNLKLHFDYLVGKNLATLLEMLVNGRNGKNSSAADPSSTSSAAPSGLSAANNTTSAASQTSSWQFSMYFSATASQTIASSATAGNALASASLQTSQTMTALVEIQMQTVQSTQFSFSSIMEMFGLVDPIVLDLCNEGINISAAEDGVYFDMHGNGEKVQTGFIQGNNALLYLDRNGNGLADNIHELFGDSEGHANGFEKLRIHDSNNDGVIDQQDDDFANLKVWRDLNKDGVNQTEESMTLPEAGITSINLNYNANRQIDQYGNIITETSTFTKTNGSTGTAADVWFRHLG